ncbi:MAG: type II toxin-antitoxin system HicB family antitoxin [Lachnospiraceae bacterium]|nr:type II toxin-antitoxin system HicB family antitoxin [Lachnospiraceae bacterium]
MNNTMEYKGYIGSIEFSETDNVFFGKILGIRSLITYEGSNGIQLVKDFHDAIDEYLNDCKKEGSVPEVAYKGSLNIRLGGDLHRRAALYAISNNQSLNSFIEDAVREKLYAVKA